MHLDNLLLDDHSQNLQTSSIVRFQSWTSPAISLGFHQKQYPQAWDAIAQTHGLDIVRRPTGGRAVLHKGDLVYSVITNVSIDGRARSHREMYEHICGFLIQGFAQLGIKLSYGTSGKGYIHNPSCFSTATNADLVVADGRKLIGSAQVYRRNSVLQHGSIAITPDYPLLAEIFQSPVPVVGCQGILTKMRGASTDYQWEGDLSESMLRAKLIEVLSLSARQYFQF
ncbi:MAG: biotin--protein ligase [Oscillatoriales cyanobacterium CG2_30_44_21]|nr:MAG: biotin--protein ligase [Oscillatoriales cyanobacterium CG2_30_44_21]